jgi:hypothetical protein
MYLAEYLSGRKTFHTNFHQNVDTFCIRRANGSYVPAVSQTKQMERIGPKGHVVSDVLRYSPVGTRFETRRGN